MLGVLCSYRYKRFHFSVAFKRADAATVRVLDAMFVGKIVPLYHEDILAEYDEVLHRSKFHLKKRQSAGYKCGETIWCGSVPATYR